MKPGQNPGKFFWSYSNAANLSRIWGRRFTSKTVILQALPAEYKRVQPTRSEKRDFVLDDTWHIVHTIYVDRVSHPSNSKPIAGSDIIMQTVGREGIDVQCNYWKDIGNLK